MCKKKKKKKQPIWSLFLPSPNASEDWNLCNPMKEANRVVQCILAEQIRHLPSLKRFKYTTFSDEQRAEVGKCTTKNSNYAALRKFRSELPSLEENTVYFFRKHSLGEKWVSNGVVVTIKPSRMHRISNSWRHWWGHAEVYQGLRKIGTPVNIGHYLLSKEGISAYQELFGQLPWWRGWK